MRLEEFANTHRQYENTRFYCCNHALWSLEIMKNTTSPVLCILKALGVTIALHLCLIIERDSAKKIGDVSLPSPV
ncbi:hypothetical protein BS50DRAFT_128001 [Corynespora cassiicola Philippines]|uniref:Uncharacterized protein n=1 Tax=Corynespora cassiicola Philippines TaxID=1448308 RepID=A0A2T2NBG5_CORCC|nr:hypothetical protein BS50DRAFT_128001 [Corynespora cassiicola Philippines]